MNITGCCPVIFSLWQVRFVSHILLLLFTYTGRIGTSEMDHLLWIPPIFTRSWYVLLALLIFFTK